MPMASLAQQFLDPTLRNFSLLLTLSLVLRDLSFRIAKVHRHYTNLKSNFTIQMSQGVMFRKDIMSYLG